jgi:hypothetical protein
MTLTPPDTGGGASELRGRVGREVIICQVVTHPVPVRHCFRRHRVACHSQFAVQPSPRAHLRPSCGLLVLLPVTVPSGFFPTKRYPGLSDRDVIQSQRRECSITV